MNPVSRSQSHSRSRFPSGMEFREWLYLAEIASKFHSHSRRSQRPGNDSNMLKLFYIPDSRVLPLRGDDSRESPPRDGRSVNPDPRPRGSTLMRITKSQPKYQGAA